CLLLYLIHRRTRPTLFPYTTLFRSAYIQVFCQQAQGVAACQKLVKELPRLVEAALGGNSVDIPETADGEGIFRLTKVIRNNVPRSEEHTSELQSRENLVCRLLLEKK